ncbi:MAG TPA: YdeI/OmpD-associated family protein [Vicinamibacteria bacterium]|nr:YdeI/OmpD-associated family protein [Vicinamibacteria bacterium]
MSARGGSAKAPRFFRSADELRAWLEKAHDSLSELWIGFFNQRSGQTGITYKQALDEALCFGWIDGVRKSVDEGRYMQRFTPRKARSIWSLVNIKRVGELRALGRMCAPGLAAFARRDEKRSGVHSFERANVKWTGALERQFRASAPAWAFFQSQPPGYRRLATWFVMSAKKDETRLKRLATLITLCAKGRRLPGLDRAPRPSKAKK